MVLTGLKQIVSLSHFDKRNKLSVVCDAGHEGLRALLMLCNQNGDWELLSRASTYLSNYESENSAKELELLAIVWAEEFFKSYIHGEKIRVVSDNKALETALEINHGNETYSIRLTRWIDRLLPFDMEVFHNPGRTMGLADFIFTHPSDFL